MKLHLLLVPALLLGSTLAAQNGTATFEVTFTSTWSKTTHPTNFPSFPHYSPLIGGTHNTKVSFWMPGGIATPGIEQMAETGGTGSLTSEINNAINKGAAKSVVSGGGLGSPASRTVRFTADVSHPHLTIVTMLAPSPDWFVGLSGAALMKNGRWIDSASFAATVWDAGTDNGVTYTSANSNTNPKQKIAVVSTGTGSPFKGYSTKVGTWTIQRIGSTQVYGCGTNPKGSMTVTGDALIGKAVTFRVNDPGKSMPNGSTAYLLFSTSATANFPCGVKIPGYGMSAAGAPGEWLLGGVLLTLPGGAWNGSPVSFGLAIPNDMSLVGVKANVQGGLAKGTRLGLADAVEVKIGK